MTSYDIQEARCNQAVIAVIPGEDQATKPKTTYRQREETKYPTSQDKSIAQ
jgi:hypothetical protein